jgi:hypothetical protein
MVIVKCLACDADNDPRATGGYCDACGKRLPPAAAYRSRRGPGGTNVAEMPGDAVVPGERYRTAESLFAVAVLQLVIGGLYLVLGPLAFEQLPPSYRPNDYLPRLLLLAVPPVVVFGALGGLARYFPLPAAVAALAFQVIWTTAGLAFGVDMALVWLPASLIVLGLLVWPLLASRRGQGR